MSGIRFQLIQWLGEGRGWGQLYGQIGQEVVTAEAGDRYTEVHFTLLCCQCTFSNFPK